MSGSEAGTADRVLSLEEYQRLPEEDAHRTELVRGRVVREPRPGARHGLVTAELILRIGMYARERGLGRVVTETGFLLSVDPPTVRGPDVAFIAADRLPAELDFPGFWTVAPDLAIEVVSPSNAAGDIQAKVLEYLDAGTRMVWVVDPGSRSVATYRSREEIRIRTGDETLEGNDVLPGFRLKVFEIFPAAR